MNYLIEVIPASEKQAAVLVVYTDCRMSDEEAVTIEEYVYKKTGYPDVMVVHNTYKIRSVVTDTPPTPDVEPKEKFDVTYDPALWSCDDRYCMCDWPTGNDTEPEPPTKNTWPCHDPYCRCSRLFQSRCCARMHGSCPTPCDCQ